MQAFEESSELSKLEIEKNENILAEFESQIEEERNEGQFFKNLALIGLMTIGIVNALMSPSDWKKVATFGAILLGLILQH